MINPQFGRRHNSSFLARFLRAPRVSHCTDTIMDCQRHALESLDNQETIWSRKKSGFDHLSDFWNQKKTPLCLGVHLQNRMELSKLAFDFFSCIGLNLLVLGIKIKFKVAATKSNHCCSRARRLLRVDPVLVFWCLCLCSFEGWQAGGREVVKSAGIEHLSLCWCQRE